MMYIFYPNCIFYMYEYNNLMRYYEITNLYISENIESYSLKGGLFMTSNIISDAFLWFFAIVGIFTFIGDIFSFAQSHLTKQCRHCIIIPVKNRQDSIECSVYKLIAENSCSAAQPEIIIVDFGSVDDTKKIAEKLAERYSFVKITDTKGFADMIRQMTP